MKKRRSQHFGQEDRLLQYAKGQLPEPDREELEAAFDSSPSLKKDARLIKNLNDVVNNPNWITSAETLLALKKEKLAELNGTTSTNELDSSTKWEYLKRHKIKILLSTLALGLGILSFNNLFLIADCDQLYNRFLEPFTKTIPTTDNARPELVAAVKAYEEGLDLSPEERGLYFEIARTNFEKVEDREEIFQFYAAVSGMLSTRVKVEDISTDLLHLRTKIESDEDGSYAHLMDWIDYYEALLLFKQKRFHEGKDKIKEIASKEDVEADLREIISPFRTQLRFLFMAK